MNIIKPYAEIIDQLNGREILKKIEFCGRVCYKSEGKTTDESFEKFISNIIKRGHESVLEHVSVSVRFVVDRGVSHEIVRHRIASFSQESTRYCNYKGNEITFIEPCFFKPDYSYESNYDAWLEACAISEKAYNHLIANGATPQEARSVLPNSLKTELIMTANLREWRHFLKLRCSSAAHPQIREVAIPLLEDFQQLIPIVFDDIEVK